MEPSRSAKAAPRPCTRWRRSLWRTPAFTNHASGNCEEAFPARLQRHPLPLWSTSSTSWQYQVVQASENLCSRSRVLCADVTTAKARSRYAAEPAFRGWYSCISESSISEFCAVLPALAVWQCSILHSCFLAPSCAPPLLVIFLPAQRLRQHRGSVLLQASLRPAFHSNGQPGQELRRSNQAGEGEGTPARE